MVAIHGDVHVHCEGSCEQAQQQNLHRRNYYINIVKLSGFNSRSSPGEYQHLLPTLLLGDLSLEFLLYGLEVLPSVSYFQYFRGYRVLWADFSGFCADCPSELISVGFGNDRTRFLSHSYLFSGVFTKSV